MAGKINPRASRAGHGGRGAAPTGERPLRLHGVEVLRWAHGGDAVAIPEDGPLAGAIVFIPGAVPGDVVTVEVVTRKKRWARARVLATERPSPERETPLCPHQAQCGGCPWMAGSAAAQAASRLAILRGEARKSLAWSEADAEARVRLVDVPGAARFGYRPRAKLGWRIAQGRVTLGFRSKGTHDLVDISQCSIAQPALNAALPTLRAHLAGRPDGRGDVTVVAGAEGVAAWVAPEQGEGYAVGPEAVTVRIGEREHHVTPRAFLQAHPEVAAAMVDAIGCWAEALGGGHAVELFAGSGALTPALWRAGFTVDAYDVDAQAAPAFAALQASLGLDAARGRWSRADLFALGVPLPAPREAADLVLLDPPRAGAAEVMPWVRAARPQAVILMSCDVATGFRDLATLADGGAYEVVEVRGYEMFPHSGHQEILALARRRDADG